MPTGYEMLGEALGGTSEKAYQEGKFLGARTHAALAEARRRVDENTAREKLAASFETIGIPADRAGAYADVARSGINLGDIMGGRLKQQELGFRDVAGSPDVSVDAGARNRALFGLASGPEQTLKAVGSRGYTDILDPSKGVLPLGDQFADAGGGRAAAVQILDAFKQLDPQGQVIDPSRAFDVMRTTGRVADAGGVPYETDFNPFRSGTSPTTSPLPGGASPVIGAPPVGAGPAAAPLVPTAETAANAQAIEAAKVTGRGTGEKVVSLPQAATRYRNTTDQANRVLEQINLVVPDVGILTSGPISQATSWIAGTPAANLKAGIDQISASIGFKGLQDMRYESPTGGALGQVAVQELYFLQSVLGSLSQAQSPAQLGQMLLQVQDAYGRFKKTAADDFAAAEMAARGDHLGAARLVAQSVEGYQSPEQRILAGSTPSLPTASAPLGVGQSTTINGFKVIRKQ